MTRGKVTGGNNSRGGLIGQTVTKGYTGPITYVKNPATNDPMAIVTFTFAIPDAVYNIVQNVTVDWEGYSYGYYSGDYGAGRSRADILDSDDNTIGTISDNGVTNNNTYTACSWSSSDIRWIPTSTFRLRVYAQQNYVSGDTNEWGGTKNVTMEFEVVSVLSNNVGIQDPDSSDITVTATNV